MQSWTARAAVAVSLVLLLGSLLAMAVGARPVVTTGTSMQPGMAGGDLVVVRPASTYQVGQAVAYRSDLLDTVVLHRIVARAGDGFVLQGDNNDFLDPERPTQDELVGKKLLHIPRGGVWLQRLTSPPALAAYAFLLLAGGRTAATTRHHRRKERRRMSPRHSASTCRLTAGLPPALKPVAAGAAVVGLTGLALSGVAWSQPTQTSIAASTSTASTMDFSYTAQVPSSPAYDGTTVTAPQPVFRALTDTVDVTYRYRGVPGQLSLTAELSTSSGWRSTMPLDSPAAIGAQHEGSVQLDLGALQQRAEAAGEVIGIPAGSVTVVVVPAVALDGGGEFAPRLELALDAVSLTATGELSANSETSTTGTRSLPMALSALGRSIDVSTARVAGLAATLLAVLTGMVLAHLSGPVSEAERVRRRHGDLVLTVLPMALAKGRPIVDVPDVETLVKLAERYGLPVLTWSRGGVDTYVVQDEGTTFRYRSGGQSETTSEVPVQRDPRVTTVLPDR